MSRTGDWIATFTGLKWYILDPDPEDVRIEDIAHALSMICRYGGHCREFYSVAEHSVRMTRLAIELDLPIETRRWALLHDGPESYLGDMVRPLKYSMPVYRRTEGITERIMMEGLGLEMPSQESRGTVKTLDDVLLMTERRDLVNHGGFEWTPRATPLREIIVPMEPSEAEQRFLTLAMVLGINGAR